MHLFWDKHLRKEFSYDSDLDICRGFFSCSFSIGLKDKSNGSSDCSILISQDKSTFSFLATQNTFRAENIKDTLKKENNLKILVVFSGNANACTGKHAAETILHFEKILTKVFSCEAKNIFFSFTGVVGRKFPYKEVSDNFENKISSLVLFLKKNCFFSPNSSFIENSAIEKIEKKITKKNIFENSFKNKNYFSKGILTTDTVEKKISTTWSNKKTKEKIKIAGCAKGAGMIYPNMATMLAYITTDLKIDFSSLQQIHRQINESSFNAISVDGDTSTNDSFFVIASGKSGVDYSTLSPEQKEEIQDSFQKIADYLSLSIINDGEGKTKIIEIKTSNAKTKESAKKIAKTIANSLLVKTAIFGNDANYGRILVALGNSREPFDPEKVKLYFGEILLYERGEVLMNHIEKATSYLQKNHNITIHVDLAEENNSFSFYTCDLSYDYVRINAEYTT